MMVRAIYRIMASDSSKGREKISVIGTTVVDVMYWRLPAERAAYFTCRTLHLHDTCIWYLLTTIKCNSVL